MVQYKVGSYLLVVLNGVMGLPPHKKYGSVITSVTHIDFMATKKRGPITL